MLSNNDIKFIRSLAMKKRRDADGLFVAEGPKLVDELLRSFRCQKLLVEDGCNFALPRGVDVEPEIVSHTTLERASMLTTSHEVLAVFEKPRPAPAGSLAQVAAAELCLALDGIQNPGNLGTIIRTADWMGVSHIYCSRDTADIYSPKSLQATMGSAARVSVEYTDIAAELEACEAPVWGTFLERGENIYSARLEQRGVVVIGNEGNGISPRVAHTVTRRIYIPPFPPGRATAESLNAGTATAITLATFRARVLAK